MRLSAEPDLALKQITTGLKKWALRYVAECPGEDKAMTQSNRLVKVFSTKISIILDLTRSRAVAGIVDRSNCP